MIAVAQCEPGTKLGLAGGAVSEVRERLQAAEQRKKLRDERLLKQMVELQEALDKIGMNQDPRSESSGTSGSSPAQAGSRGPSRPPLLRRPTLKSRATCGSRTPSWRDDVLGLERGWRPKRMSDAALVHISSPNFHRLLTVKLRSYAEAEKYTRAVSGKVLDRQGRAVEIIPKRAMDRRPPQVNRRGSALAPVYQELKAVLQAGESLEQVHFKRGMPKYTKYYGVLKSAGDAPSTVRELVAIECWGDGEVVALSVAKHLGTSFPVDVKNAVKNLTV